LFLQPIYHNITLSILVSKRKTCQRFSSEKQLQWKKTMRQLGEKLQQEMLSPRVQLYLYAPSGPSWPILGWTYLFLPVRYTQIFDLYNTWWWSCNVWNVSEFISI